MGKRLFIYVNYRRTANPSKIGNYFNSKVFRDTSAKEFADSTAERPNHVVVAIEKRYNY